MLYTNVSLKDKINSSTQPPPETAENNSPSSNDRLSDSVILNGDFEQGGLGWNNPYAIQKEENGNHYVINNYNWLIKQDMNLTPGKTYEISADTKKGTATGPARVVITFLDVNGNRLKKYYDILYTHTGTGWEEITHQLITVPENAVKTRVYLLSKDEKGYHCFDNIILTWTGNSGN